MTLLDIGSEVFSEWGKRNRNFLLPALIVLRVYTPSLYTVLNEKQGGNWDYHTKTHCGYSCCNENFQILPTSDFHRLADDANENHDYTECLFIL